MRITRKRTLAGVIVTGAVALAPLTAGIGAAQAAPGPCMVPDGISSQRPCDQHELHNHHNHDNHHNHHENHENHRR